MIKRYILMMGVSILLWACPFTKENTPTNPIITVENNIPVTVSDTDKFTFEIQADAYSMDKSTAIDFSTGQLLIVTTVSRQGGSGSIVLLDKDLNVLKSIDLSQSQISTNRLSLDAVPAMVTVKLVQFSGNISFVLKKQ